ncbi:MAG: alkaline phosphatase [Spirochaetes bacterium GWF1_31_7]|nr:MAG: alkaline phosphatase [Spirochaetes bacterium GWE1_32_154]OHD47441.1 MAG: alkaline phosphatase [Spirochaetes bacterium GWF1_31_7]OHD49484.1 MAG: alkaline phosphatase [Spirochaetes bacterium GWE2_31_10]OHD79694.1 MAG: alkaline phosphatase [Spirochaetes bacterium RIFOXYB1_FULL_32_8]HBD96225.1 alkaline phosphatase [Spirochaetia bacterium]
MKKLLMKVLVVFLVVTANLSAATNNDFKGKMPKYVFLFIGDGMSMAQVAATEMYLAASGTKPDQTKLSFSQFDAQGLTTTYDAGSLITDSASAITAIASGNKTLSGVINMDTTKTKKFTTIAEMAKAKGKKVGVVTSVSLDHATPAGYYAKEVSRGNYYDIGIQLAKSNFDYFGGGGFVQPTGKNKDQKDIYEVIKENGYTLALNNDDFKKLKNGEKSVAINAQLADGSSMNYEVDRKKDILSLADFTQKGIEVLDNKNGFFLTVEGGKIDWACHANDALSSILDTIAFDDSVKVAIEFMKKNPKDTLIIVTGDHETGGMSIGFAGTQYSTFFNKLKGQKISYVGFDTLLATMKKEGTLNKFEDILPIIKENFGLTTDDSKSDLFLNEYELNSLKEAFKLTAMNATERPKNDMIYLQYGGYEPLTIELTHIINKKAGIAWTSYSHTAVPVPTYASGSGSDLFNGYYDNTDIFFKLKSIMGVK